MTEELCPRCDRPLENHLCPDCDLMDNARTVLDSQTEVINVMTEKIIQLRTAVRLLIDECEAHEVRPGHHQTPQEMLDGFRKL